MSKPSKRADTREVGHELSAIFAEPDLVDRIFEYVAEQFPEIKGALTPQMKTDLRSEFGGDKVYVRLVSRQDRDARVRSVLSLFNGRNASEVARELRIGRTTVYRILKQSGR